MKKLLILFISLFCNYLQSQTIPNASFENWVSNNETGHAYTIPQNWITYDMLETTFFGDTLHSVSRTTQSHNGQYALLMQSATDSLGYTLGGQVYSCNSLADINNYYGFYCNSRPASLQGYFKLTSSGGDVGMITLFLTKWNIINNKRDTLFAETFQTTAAPANYTLFNMPLTYSLNEIPDTASLQLGIQALSGGFTHIGTQFFIDDLNFMGSIAMGINSFAQNNEMKLYPNPALGNFTIENPYNKAKCHITDVNGKIVLNQTISHKTIIDTDFLEIGVYNICIIGDNGVLNKRLVIAK